MFSTNKKNKFSLVAITGAIFISGCTPMSPAKDAEYHEQATEINKPAVRPTRSISNFSNSLMCMDHLFRETGVSTVLITSKSIPDYSGKIAVATKEMVVTALSQMSRVSNAFRFVDYEVNIAQQDTVQNLTTLLLNNNQIRLQRPALYVSGAVAFVDQQVISNNFDAGTSASRLETGYSKTRRSSVIGLELHLGDFRSRTIIPGLDSANEIVIGSGGQGLDLSGRIGNYGIQFNVGRDYTQGSGPAIRTLVELGMIELLGKWARVPYWQCLTLEQNHPEFIRQMREWYDDAGESDRKQLIQRLLTRRGYIAAGNQVDDATLRSAISKFQADERLVVTGVIDFPTYEKSFSDFVELTPEGHLKHVGWKSKQASEIAVAQSNESPATKVDLQVENIMLGRNGFEQGEQIFLSATVSKTAYLSCYMRNARNEVIRILPNDTNKSGWVQANQAIRIPDWMSPNPGFVIDAGIPGKESVACFASNNDLSATLPAPLKVGAFKPITGVTSISQIESDLKQAAGTSDSVSMGSLEWEVLPRRNSNPMPQ